MTFIIFLALLLSVAWASLVFYLIIKMIKMFVDENYIAGILLLISGIWLIYFPTAIIVEAIHIDKEAFIEIPLQNDTITVKNTIKYEDVSNH